uniref:Sm domain-containing protein n=1 Tax=Geospiza parvula TaxID=87175 RepID=A0A8U8B1G3_GEOPR
MADPPEEAGGGPAAGPGVAGPPRGRQRLEALLNRSLRIRMSDGRTLVGAFLCTDRQSNVILGSAQEFLKAAGPGGSWGGFGVSRGRGLGQFWGSFGGLGGGWGAFLCTDPRSNVILGSAQEFLKAAGLGALLGVLGQFG